MDRLLIFLFLMIPFTSESQTVITPAAVPNTHKVVMWVPSNIGIGNSNKSKYSVVHLNNENLAVTPNGVDSSFIATQYSSLSTTYDSVYMVGAGDGAISLFKYVKANPSAKKCVFITSNPDSLFNAMVKAGIYPDSSKYILINQYAHPDDSLNKVIRVPVYNPNNPFDSASVNVSNILTH